MPFLKFHGWLVHVLALSRYEYPQCDVNKIIGARGFVHRSYLVSRRRQPFQTREASSTGRAQLPLLHVAAAAAYPPLRGLHESAALRPALPSQPNCQLGLDSPYEVWPDGTHPSVFRTCQTTTSVTSLLPRPGIAAAAEGTRSRDQSRCT